MDEMRIKLSTNLMKGLVSKIISKLVYKNVGVKPEINIQNIELDMKDGKIFFHIDVDGCIGKEIILKLNKMIDLDE